MPPKVITTLRDNFVTGKLIVDGLHAALFASQLLISAGLTEDDLVEMGVVPRALRKSVLLALDDLIQARGMCC